MRDRVAPELFRLHGKMKITGYDLQAPSWETNGVPCVIVRDDSELETRLLENRPQSIYVATWHDLHPRHVKIALRSGAKLVLCEKPVAEASSEASRLSQTIAEAASNDQCVIWLDHYLLVPQILALWAMTPVLLGNVEFVEVVLYEQKALAHQQRRSHRDGMAGFYHHALAIAGLWFDLDDLEPIQSAWAKYPGAQVPDTYRACRYISKKTGNIVMEGAVGKGIRYPRKIIRVWGTKGLAWIDRDRDPNALFVLAKNERVPRHYKIPGSPYGILFKSLAYSNAVPRTLLTFQQALRVLELVERAQIMAKELPNYPQGPHIVFG